MSRQPSVGDEEEEIVVHPSTELIADEYEHFLESTKNIEVHTFVTKFVDDHKNVESFTETLNKNNYEIKAENTHCLDSDNIFQVLKNIRSSLHGATASSVNGLILYFSGVCRGKGGVDPKEGGIDVFDGTDIVTLNIEEIWNKFTTSYCPELKNKPKIFIFHITSLGEIETDGKIRLTYSLAYETPAEADILIVYHKTDVNYQREFTEKLCDNINNYGRNEDIISLVTCIDSILFETRPMIISTLTRKFYFTASDFRGLHLDIDQSHKQLKEHLKEVHDTLTQVNKSTKKKKKILSFNLGRKRTEGESREVVRSEKITNNIIKKHTSTTNSIGKSNEMRTENNQNTNIPNTSRYELDGATLPNQDTKPPKTSKSKLSVGRPRWSFSLNKN